MNHPEIERGFRPQLHYFLMLFLWLSIAGTALLYVWFVKTNVWRPHVAWFFLTFGSILFFVLTAGFLVIRRFWHGSHRTWAIGTFMLTIAPLVFFGSFIWLVVLMSSQRADLQLSLPVRAFGIMAGDYFELEARWRYSRFTEGQHVQLFHDERIKDPKKLVAKMDEHIQSMATVLGQQPTEWKMAWVRGSLCGQKGRAVGLWAICNVNRRFDRLAYIDKHEIAHTLITSLCEIDQEPPMLLAEGWAVLQSSRTHKMLSVLLARKAGNDTWSLMELVTDERYGHSVGPAYDHGGPVAMYLIERFGGEKFLQLYGGVRRPTFLEDAERILGVPWQQIDQDFWKWLDKQDQEVIQPWLNSVESDDPDDLGQQPQLTFSSDDVRKNWNKVRTSILKHERILTASRPDDYAIQAYLDTPPDSNQVFLVSQGKSSWLLSEYDNNKHSSTYAFKNKDGDSFYTSEYHDEGRLSGETNLRRDNIVISSFIDFALEKTRMGSLRDEFQFDIVQGDDPSNTSFVELHELIAGGKEFDPWKMMATETWDEEEPPWTYEIELDPSNGFQIIRSTQKSKNSSTRVTENETDLIWGHHRVNRSVIESTYKDDNKDASESKETTKERKSQLSYTFRILNDEEIDLVKQRVEAMRNKGRGDNAWTWNQILVNPYTVGFGWPILAFIILGIDMVGDRVKIRIPAHNPTEPKISEEPDDGRD